MNVICEGDFDAPDLPPGQYRVAEYGYISTYDADAIGPEIWEDLAHAYGRALNVPLRSWSVRSAPDFVTGLPQVGLLITYYKPVEVTP